MMFSFKLIEKVVENTSCLHEFLDLLSHFIFVGDIFDFTVCIAHKADRKDYGLS